MKTKDITEPKKPAKHPRRYGKQATQYLDESELEALFKVIGTHPRDRAIFEVAFHRGLRASEVGLLKFDHFRVRDRHLTIPRLKGGPTHDFLLTDREMVALRSWIRVRGTAPGPLFPSRNSRPISRKRLHALMQDYGTRAGLPESKRHFHCLRHSAGTILSEKADLQEVQDHLGHRDIRSTMVYAKIRNKRRKDLGERLRSAW